MKKTILALFAGFMFCSLFSGPVWADKYKSSRIDLANGAFLWISTVDVNKKSRQFLVSCGKIKNPMRDSLMRSAGIDPLRMKLGQHLTLRNYWRKNQFGYEFKCHKKKDLEFTKK